MSDLDDLGFTSITEMSTDDAIEMLRQIRLARRTPLQPTKVVTKKQTKAPKVNAEQAAELLKLLTGGE